MTTNLSALTADNGLSISAQFSSHDLQTIARDGVAFQSIKVMEAIVEAEQSRIQKERMAWRIGGMIIGGLFGIGDGFDATDLLTGLAVGNLASLGHEVASHEQLEMLKQCKADWLVTASSPIELARRLGAPRFRVVMAKGSWKGAQLLSLHQGARGDYLIPLDCAHRCAHGFTDSASHAALVNTFEADNYQALANQLYPIESQAVRVESVRKLTKAEVAEMPDSPSRQPSIAEPVVFELDGQSHIGQRFPVPIHSDF
ncbi:MAG: Uncharacterised protein [Prochlorococcus marinus str. MIT 9215]|nr:MAG: Uncharacterised protein [Prochlorococcus marinus str. MIT 9215]